MKVIAHKADSREEIERSLKLGVDLIEFDIWPIKERRFLVFHDVFLERLGRHNSWTMYLTQREIDDLRREHGGLLYLEEALELVGGRVETLVELKRTRHAEESFSWVEEELLRILKDNGALEWAILISFDHLSLLRLKELCPEARVGMLCAGEWLNLWNEVDRVSPQILLPHWAQNTPRLVREAHCRGMEVFAWVANNPDIWEILWGIGADGIITDRPEELLEFRQKHGKAEVGNGSLLPR